MVDVIRHKNMEFLQELFTFLENEQESYNAESNRRFIDSRKRKRGTYDPYSLDFPDLDIEYKFRLKDFLKLHKIDPRLFSIEFKDEYGDDQETTLDYILSLFYDSKGEASDSIWDTLGTPWVSISDIKRLGIFIKYYIQQNDLDFSFTYRPLGPLYLKAEKRFYANASKLQKQEPKIGGRILKKKSSQRKKKRRKSSLRIYRK